jgi:hypothetical protein
LSITRFTIWPYICCNSFVKTLHIWLSSKHRWWDRFSKQQEDSNCNWSVSLNLLSRGLTLLPIIFIDVVEEEEEDVDLYDCPIYDEWDWLESSIFRKADLLIVSCKNVGDEIDFLNNMRTLIINGQFDWTC